MRDRPRADTLRARPVRRRGVARPTLVDPPNEHVLEFLRGAFPAGISTVVLERVESYGMPVGREVFDTVLWTGRFLEASYPVPVRLVPRRDVKLNLCGLVRARDASVRVTVLDRFGGRSTAIGRKSAPGPFTGSQGTPGPRSRSR